MDARKGNIYEILNENMKQLYKSIIKKILEDHEKNMVLLMSVFIRKVESDGRIY